MIVKKLENPEGYLCVTFCLANLQAVCSALGMKSPGVKSKYLNTHKYTYYSMAHKTITVSEEAYEALARMKNTSESFTEVILRLTTKGNAQTVLEFVKKLPTSEDLANNIEVAMKRARKAKLKKIRLNLR